MDALLDMLRTMRLSGSVFLEAEFTEPWCVTAQVGPEDCAPYAPVPHHIIAYHYVAAGNLLLKVDGQRPIELRRGEMVLLPRNDHHVLGSTMNIDPIRPDALIKPGPDGGLARIVYGGGGELTQIVCGFLGTQGARVPVLEILPSVLKIDAADGASGDWIDSSFRFAARELAEGETRSPTMLAGLAELLFMEAVRRYLASHASDGSRWSAATKDQTVARALGLLHGDLARHWTTDELAREAGLSRSAFADRFTRVLGEPPMRYLARQRLERAAAHLRESSDPISRIAYEVGYESEAAFSRAFKREYSVPPAEWRTNWQGQ